MAKKIVKFAVLCRALRISSRGRTLQNAGIIKYVGGMYSVASVNQFLRKSARNFEEPPTFDDLMNGRVVLLRAAEIQQRYPELTPAKLHFYRSKGEVAYLRFPAQSEERGAIRYRQSDILRIAQASFDGAPLQTAARMLGLKLQGVRKLLHQGKLERVTNPKDKTHAYVSWQSLMKVLRERLPPWISPEDWIEDCEAVSEPLVPLDITALRIGLNKTRASAFLRRSKAMYIAGPKGGGRIMTSPLWLAAFDERDKVPTASDVGRLFDVNWITVYGWLKKGLIVCPIPGHTHVNGEDYLRRVCWIAILRENCSPGLRVAHFVTTRLNSKGRTLAKLISHRKTATELRCSEAEAVKLGETGVLHGVRTPTGHWMLYVSSVEEVKRLRQP